MKSSRWMTDVRPSRLSADARQPIGFSRWLLSFPLSKTRSSGERRVSCASTKYSSDSHPHVENLRRNDLTRSGWRPYKNRVITSAFSIRSPEYGCHGSLGPAGGHKITSRPNDQDTRVRWNRNLFQVVWATKFAPRATGDVGAHGRWDQFLSLVRNTVL